MLSSHSFSQQKHAAGSAEIRGYEKIQASVFPTPSLWERGNNRPVPYNWLRQIFLPNCSHSLYYCGLMASPKLAGCSVLAQATPSPGEMKGDKPPSISPPQQGRGSHCTNPSGSPAHPPACLRLPPISDSQMRIINTEKGRH